jgi:autotransporter-associated beta strand protein
MRLSSRRRRAGAIGLACAAAAAAAALAMPADLHAQVATLGKGHSYFVNNGLQIWGLDQGAAVFNYNNLAGANFNGVMWSWEQAHKVSLLTPGQKWGKWTDPNGNPANALNATEQGKFADLVALQVGDEQQSDLENPNGVTKTWFQNAHAGNHFPNQLLYTNSFFINDDGAFANFIAQANPDAISFDSYPFDEPYGSVILPNNWLVLAGRFRRHALSSYATFNGAPIGSNAPRPYGMYLQTYAASEGPGRATRHPGDVEMRWQQFTAWTMGFTFVDAFTVGGSSSLFNNSNHNDISQPRYDQFKETARQGRNLGPALTRLISYGYGPSIVIGKDAAGNNNPVPSDWLPFNAADAPANQRFLTSLSADNIGTKNNDQPGDVYVGFFNPLHASFGNPAGTTYFMVTNALGAYLDDETATVADTRQEITLNFDFQYSGVSSLLRLRREDGQLEHVPLTRIAGPQYRGIVQLDGGTGDLFKYNDGAAFVGAPSWVTYWDADGNASGNNASTGAGLGGGGTWDAASARWFNGSANAAWPGTRDAIFTGTGGAVTLASPQTVNSVTFKSNGYALNNSTLNMAGSFVTVDGGVTATINSQVAGSGGLAKSGPGTLILTNNSNNYSGGTMILGGVLRVSSDAQLGVVPATLTQDITLNGGTLQFGASFDIANTRAIAFGPSGGTIDTNGFTNPSGYNATAGGFRGPGDLTKVGSGTFFAAATTGGANTTWKGRLILKEGTWKIVASDGLPYNVPLADGLKADQITFVGGTLQAAANMNITNARRGMTVGAGGGTIDTQGFNFAWAGPLAMADGLPGAPTFTKIGSGTLTFTATGTASTYGGRVNVDGGTLSLGNGAAMGDNAWITLANAPGVTLNITGNETIGPLIGGGAAGGNVTLANGVTLTTGHLIGGSFTYGGVISGNGGVTKAGAGISRFSGNNTYTGATRATDGGLVLLNSHTHSSQLAASGDAVVEVASGGGNMRVLKTGALTITESARVDLRDNKLITTTPVGVFNGTNYTGVQGEVARAYNFGAWDQPGLTTSMESAGQNAGPLSGTTTIGVATAEQVLFIAPTETGVFAGQTVTGATTIAMYTYAGDLNFDGLVDGADYGVIDNSVQFPGTSGYANGDFNYDGTIDGADYGIIDNTIQLQGEPIATTASSAMTSAVSAVPEPAACGFAVLCAGAMLRRRRRRRRRGGLPPNSRRVPA